jgi:hypothetical protein
MPRSYKEAKSRVLLVETVGGSKDVNTEVEGSTALEAVIRQRLVRIQRTEYMV